MICIKTGCSGDITSDESIGHGIVRCVICNSLYTIAYNPLRLEEYHGAVIGRQGNITIESKAGSWCSSLAITNGGNTLAFRNSWGPEYGTPKQSSQEEISKATQKQMYCGSCGKPLKPMPADGKAHILQGDGPWLLCECGKGGVSSSSDPEEKLSNFHRWNEGITPYMKCPWCGYANVAHEFVPYSHPYDTTENQDCRGSTECGQCMAAGPTAMFILAYNKDAELYDCEQYRDLYLSNLNSTPKG